MPWLRLFEGRVTNHVKLCSGPKQDDNDSCIKKINVEDLDLGQFWKMGGGCEMFLLQGSGEKRII